ncbi:uncharacterized protein EI90DRAFT_3037308 [Cantharellus anzutake]|uniref:uncharacterized protein n=1 Tax=Cantharellus anzutake TaxID=1750568 RepID=UPI001903B4DB|nr:uncharacterized protein EI90DRAFT_3037308 [Cantharellus anzutake]KAF8339635.1 hypothetical protein EI90DRAFT_3037308 [Cantharellus anzutake]
MGYRRGRIWARVGPLDFNITPSVLSYPSLVWVVWIFVHLRQDAMLWRQITTYMS